jgi:hypothetical protein
MPKQRPWMVVVCRGGGVEPLYNDGHVGNDRGLAWFWVAAWNCAGREFFDLANLTLSNT